tara:strand:- start:2 stop:664 length:663 start_codon:yes stop_codon:yes gene_type:complete
MMEGSKGGYEYDRDSMMDLLKRNNVPYVEVKIHLDGVQRESSPIGHIADSFEMLVNSLLGDIVMTASSDAGHILSYYTQLLDNLCRLSGLIMNEEGRLERMKEGLAKMIKEGKYKEGREEGEEEEGRKTEIPNIFLLAFNEGKEEEGEQGGKEEEEEEGGSTEEGGKEEGRSIEEERKEDKGGKEGREEGGSVEGGSVEGQEEGSMEEEEGKEGGEGKGE